MAVMPSGYSPGICHFFDLCYFACIATGRKFSAKITDLTDFGTGTDFSSGKRENRVGL